jgi:hypothetical protein
MLILAFRARDQTRGEVTCSIVQSNWPDGSWDWSKPLKVQNLDIKLTLTEISIGIKGKPPLLKVREKRSALA